MEELNKNILNKAIHYLPQHKAPDKCWCVIENQINNSETENNPEVLEEAILNLPVYKAKDTIWNEIDKNLNNSSKEKGQKLRLFYKISKIAAVLILLIGVTFFFKNVLIKRDTEAVFYTTETVMKPQELNTEDGAYNNLGKLIRLHCSTTPTVCKKDEFIELNSMLTDLEKEEENLIKVSKKSSTQDLTKFLSRISNQKIEIQKEILQMFI